MIRHVLFLALAVAARGMAAQETPESLFAGLLGANRYALSLDHGELAGPGADFLVRGASKAQFFAIGEEHNVAEIPPLTAALFQRLHDRYGFNYLADEQDVWMCSEISKPPYLGRGDAIRRLREKYPNAFTFAGDEEIEMLTSVGRLSIGKADRIWGLDQIFGALHVLERLEAQAADEVTRRRVRSLIEFARPYESARYTAGKRLMSDIDVPPDLAGISSWYRPRAKDPEAAFLAGQLSTSLRIYANHRRSVSDKQPTRYESNREREENMKDLFLLRYQEAEKRDRRLPRVVLKFGHWHLYRGQNPAGVFTLGNFASEFAKSNGLESFAVAIFLDDGPGGRRDWASWAPWARPLIAAELPAGWTVFDLRPLRGRADAGRLGAVAPELWRLLFGFDAIIVMKATHPATRAGL